MTFTSKRAMPVQVAQENHQHATPGNSVSSRKKEAARNRKLGISKPAAFNIKANTQNNYMSKWKYIKKLQDREHRKHHSLMNRRITSEMVEPPIFVAVVGPPGVGKSLLIRSLIKHYTTAKISDCRGPMTILANKHRRITFFECPNDLNAMIDIGKSCDLALLLVDASYGFEMETFEFLNAAQVHGFPRVMGVLTHLDLYKKLKKKQSIVYHVKHRFWKEIYAGAKLFILKGLDSKTNSYFKSDIVNLVRFISVLKFRPLVWRNAHPYILSDRFEDLTEPVLIQENPKIDRRIAFYGYVRGCNFRPNMNVHLFGVGDFDIQSIQEMEDPMPLPSARNRINKSRLFKSNKNTNINTGLRRLVKTGNVYAPMANIGPIIFDKNAAYITVRRDVEQAVRDDNRIHSWETKESYLKRLKKEASSDEMHRLVDIKQGIGYEMIERLNRVEQGNVIDVKMKSSKLQLFSNSQALSEHDVERFEYERKLNKLKNNQSPEAEAEAQNQNRSNKSKSKSKSVRQRRRVHFEDDIKHDNGKIAADVSDFSESDDTDGNYMNVNENNNNKSNVAVDNDDVSAWLESSGEEDDNEEDDDIKVVPVSADIGTGTNTNTATLNQSGTLPAPNSFFSSNWLDSRAEKSRKQNEIASNKLKEHKKKVKSRSRSTNLTQSNVQWKQNLLTNASQIWKTQINLQEYVYGNDIQAQQKNASTNNNSNNAAEESDSDSDGEFFRIRQTSKMVLNEIDTIDSAVMAFKLMNVKVSANNSNVGGDEDAKDINHAVAEAGGEEMDEEAKIEERLRNRFVTGDWVAAQTFEKEVRNRAMNVNPDLFDEEIQRDRSILESLGAQTTDESRNNFDEAQLDWEYRLEKLMQDKGIDGEISMAEKIQFAQQGIFAKQEIENKQAEVDERMMSELFDKNNDNTNSNSNLVKNADISTLELEDLDRLEAKIRKKQDFNREFDAGLLDKKDNVYDLTGISEDQQRKIFKNPYNTKVKRDRQGKIRGQGELNLDDRKNLPGKGEYYMDIVRAELQKQQEINLEEFADENDAIQQELRGFLPGNYIRIIVDNVPHEFVTNFDLEYPVLLGGLLAQEMQFGYTQCRIKKHRWFKRLLKFNDPLILSIGWRRFQTCPLYCVEDTNQKRLRLVKYTPDYLHCLGIFYGPITPPNTGFLGFQSCSSEVQGFRVAATGNILSSNLSYKVVKKLKLIGEPYEIHRNTAFIKGMFNSQLEVSKFIGAKIRTVSGVRGAIKKCEGPQGNFRATFEDKLLKSDLIFLKTWIPIYPLQFFYAARNLLLVDKETFQGMKTVGQLRAETNTRPIFKPDSVYRNTTDANQGGRAPIRKFNKLYVPKTLEEQLPYRIRPKYQRNSSSNLVGVNGDSSHLDQSDFSTKTRKLRHLSQQNYALKEDKIMSKMISNISEIAANHNERRTEQKRKERKRKRVFRKQKTVDDRAKKRQKIKQKVKAKSSYDGSRFEAVRGNKFHKEWRLQKN